MATKRQPATLRRGWRDAAHDTAYARGIADAQRNPDDVFWYSGDTEDVADQVGGPDLTHRLSWELDEICRIAYNDGVQSAGR